MPAPTVRRGFRTKFALLGFVAAGKGLEDLVSVKVRFLQRGNATDFDLRVLDGIHENVLRRLDKLRVRGRAVLNEVEMGSLGVPNSKVRVVGHDPAWTEYFSKEAGMLRGQLGDCVVQIHHVGSTAIPGLPAKPIIDIAVEVDEVGFDEHLNACRKALDAAGYKYLGDRGQKGGHMFEKSNKGMRTHAIQVHPAGSEALNELIRFRQMLLGNDDLAREYAEVKAALAELFPRQRLIYVWYKTHWLEDLFLNKSLDHAWGRWLVCAHIPTMVGILVRSVYRRPSRL